RNHDGEGLCVAPIGTAGAERAGVLPDQGHAAFDVGGLVVLLNHGRRTGGLKGPRKPQGHAKSTQQALRMADWIGFWRLNRGCFGPPTRLCAPPRPPPSPPFPRP